MRARWIRRGWLLAAAVAASGCGGENSNARFVPPPGAARRALEAALRSWQQGAPPGRLAGMADPAIVVVDGGRRPGQRLAGFSILGETAGEGPRCFAVRLRLEEPTEEQRQRFVVFGIDPLWVYRYEDFERMIHWECGVEERGETSAPAAEKPKREGADAAR